MYIPRLYRNTDIDAVKEFIRHHGFAILVSQAEGRPWATHIPLHLGKNEDGREVLTGHVSRANVQWKSFPEDTEVLAIFTGPHAYVSSSWYDHENVPTWNYVAVHVYGKVRIISGEQLKDQLGKMVEQYEVGMEHPVKLENMSAHFVEKEMKGIVGFEIAITEIQAASKLSQNRDEKNHQRIVSELERQHDPGASEIARRMKERKRDQG